MKMKPLYIFIVIAVCICMSQSAFAQHSFSAPVDSISLISADSIGNYNETIAEKPYKYLFIKNDSTWESNEIIKLRLDSLVQLPKSYADSLLYQSNPFIAPLIFLGKNVPPLNTIDVNKLSLFTFKKKDSLSLFPTDIKVPTATERVLKLRAEIREEINRNHPEWYTTTYENLPDLRTFSQRYMQYKPIGSIPIDFTVAYHEKEKLRIKNIKKLYWRKKLTALFQFSENYISSNWYQGGNSNLALLSVIAGQITYDNQKDIQWENNMEWRAGFNSVEGDTLRNVTTNDDLLRYTTKFGVKAFGNWYYSISGETSTQLFDNYKAVNSNVLKARFLTPLRVNLGIGMDYKYKKLLSLMVAPVSFKYIYVNDTVNVNPNLFGVEKGENHLREIGSSFNAQLTYSPMLNWQMTSRLTFFTNYKKVETDWEIVNNFTFNRFISARLLLNPRYDNTVIEKKGEKARIQFKQLLSIGLSLRLI